jgi:ABC-2 type transport system permease protein
MVAASQVLAVLGWGAWFPWSVPAILVGAGGPSVEPVTLGGVVIVVAASVVGLVATMAWWERADQTG